MKIHPVFHISLLEPAPKEAPVQEDAEAEPDQDEYEVEQILDTKKFGRIIKYLIKWKGYEHNDNTWEPIEHLQNCPEKLREFHRQNPDRPKPRPTAQATRHSPRKTADRG